MQLKGKRNAWNLPIVLSHLIEKGFDLIMYIENYTAFKMGWRIGKTNIALYPYAEGENRFR